ncbi:MAG TPA: AMP-binding protein [Methylomirabilota bacterium]|nr:AMP-binding protein [Methylomirabilota bacterium]
MAGAFSASEVEGSVPARFARVAAARGDALAIVGDDRRLTYRELDRRSDAVARAILGAGGADDLPIAVHADVPAATILAMLATWKAGRFCVPLDPTLPPARLEAILRDAEASLVVTDGAPSFDVGARPVIRLEALDLDAGVPPLRPEVGADALACLLYTSGSTGEPKGVVRTHRNLLHRARCAVGSLGIGPDDRVSALHSPAFGAGLRDVLAALLGGATLLPFDVRRAGMAALAEWIEREAITVLCAVVTTLRHFLGSLDTQRRFPSIRIVRLGSEALFREDVERLRARLAPGCVLVAGYGASEASGIVEYRIGPDTALAPGRVPAGYPLEGVEILILGEDGAPRAAGESGEIAVRSRYLSPGYWRRPDRTRATFSGDATGNAPRVYRTGDLGRLAPDGCLELIGRLDHQVKVRGYLVHPDEIERHLLEHEEIRQAAVAGQEDASGNTRIVAYVVPAGDSAPTPAALRAFLGARLPEYMMPAMFVHLATLPVTPSGKVDRAALPPAEAAGRPGFVHLRNPLEHQIASIWEALLGVRPIGATDDFFELGGSSLHAAAFVASLERVCGRVIPPSALLEASTVGALAAALLANRAWLRKPLLTLRARGKRLPFFYLHGDYNGGGLYCHALARGLDPERPFYVLHPHGIDGRAVPSTIEEMAVDRLAILRAARPHGPYLLGGYCNGAFVALEMARRLRAEGEWVGVTILVESQAPTGAQVALQRVVDRVGTLRGFSDGSRRRIAARVDHLSDRITRWSQYYGGRVRELRVSSWTQKAALARRALASWARGIVRRLGLVRASERPPAPAQPTLGRRHVYRATLRRYAPPPFDGRTVLLRAEGEPAHRHDLGWSRLIPKVEVGVIPGEHLTCITRHVDAFAVRLEAILKTADTASQGEKP